MIVTHSNKNPEEASVKDASLYAGGRSKHNELVDKEKKKWQRGPEGCVMEMTVHSVNEPNEERSADDERQHKQVEMHFQGFVV